MSEERERGDGGERSGRRDFLKAGMLAGAAAALGGLGASAGCAATDRGRALGPAPEQPMTAPPMERVRIGFVGVGGMGSHHVRNLLRVEGAEIHAVCDIVPEKVERIRKWVEEAGQPKPTGYSRGAWDFVRMCETEDLDLVFTATPWRWHVPVCTAAMRNGKHAATEVPAAVTLEECWELVETSEKERKHCVMMENCCYNRAELMVLHMVRRGMLGEVLHAECGYLHDLRGIKFSDQGEGLWRLDHSIARNGNLYPTHGLGPVAQCMNINRGDRFDYLVSMSSPSRGLNLYAAERFGEDDPRATRSYALGDVNTCLIKTAKGRTIYVVHDTNLPRPYSRINTVQGTKGLFSGYPDRLHIEGMSPPHEWEPAEKYFGEYDHPLWKGIAARAAEGGHGGMDYIEDYRLIQCLRRGHPTDMDVYDAADWSVVSALTERSVARGSEPVAFPDFTRGRWRTRAPLGIVEA
jgi:hypothetical protein